MKKRVSWFLIIFFSLMALVLYYVGWRLASAPLHWTFLAVLGFFLLLLPTMHWKMESETVSKFRKFLQQASYFSMGILSWLFVITVLRDAIILSLYWFTTPDIAQTFEVRSSGDAAFIAAILVSLTGILWAYRGLKVRNVIVPMFDLPDSMSGFKVVQISDLHVGPTIGKSYVDKVVSTVESLNPDVTVLTGDIVDGNLADLKDEAEGLKRLAPQGRVYFVPGNHEYYWALHEWIDQFKEWGITVLLNKGELFSHNSHQVWVGGVTDPVGSVFGKGHIPNATSAAEGGENADLRLLLSHRPGMAAAASKERFHLQLSGHTHGGQFFPWTYIAKLFHQYYIGLMKHEDMWIYVSPGTGSWGPPMRLGTTPEVTCLKLEKAQ